MIILLKLSIIFISIFIYLCVHEYLCDNIWKTPIIDKLRLITLFICLVLLDVYLCLAL